MSWTWNWWLDNFFSPLIKFCCSGGGQQIIWNIVCAIFLLFCMNPDTVNQKMPYSCLVCNLHTYNCQYALESRKKAKSHLPFWQCSSSCQGGYAKMPRIDFMPLLSDVISIITHALCAFPKWPYIQIRFLFFYDLTYACLLLCRMMNLTDLFGPFLFSRLHNCEWFRVNQGPASSQQ